MSCFKEVHRVFCAISFSLPEFSSYIGITLFKLYFVSISDIFVIVLFVKIMMMFPLFLIFLSYLSKTLVVFVLFFKVFLVLFSPLFSSFTSLSDIFASVFGQKMYSFFLFFFLIFRLPFIHFLFCSCFCTPSPSLLLSFLLIFWHENKKIQIRELIRECYSLCSIASCGSTH